MKLMVKGARLAGLLVPALALAAPAFAQVRDPTLSDSTEPGSAYDTLWANNADLKFGHGGKTTLRQCHGPRVDEFGEDDDLGSFS